MKAGMFSFIVMPLFVDWSVERLPTVYIGELNRQARYTGEGYVNHDFTNHIRPPPLLFG